MKIKAQTKIRSLTSEDTSAWALIRAFGTKILWPGPHTGTYRDFSAFKPLPAR